jgi:S-DNA-T family DNA segregation ATPase FtsK/SpoIIIE
VEKDNAVVVIDRNGRPIRAAKPDRKKSLHANPKKQIDAITDYLRAIAEEKNIKVRPLWLEPIDPNILLDDIKAKYNITRPEESFILNPCIGEYDDPDNQKQGVLTLPLSSEGNTIIYGSAGSGKTTFINTLLTSLMQDHTPEDINIYLCDFSTETLRAFAQAPHVGDVVFGHENEKMTNLFKKLHEEISKRKKNFVNFGGDYTTYMRATNNLQTAMHSAQATQSTQDNQAIQAAPEHLPNIIVVIHNYAAFAELYEDNIQALTNLTREGSKYGIYFILTTIGVNSVRFSLLQNFKQLFVLQLNDPNDYYAIVGRTEGLLPSKYRGRGLVKLDNLYEFQISHITHDPIPFSHIQAQSQASSKQWQGGTASGIPVLPEKINIDCLTDHIRLRKHEYDQNLTDLSKQTLPIGVESDSLKVHQYPFGHSYINLVLSESNESHPFLYDMAHLIAYHCKINTILLDAPGSFVHKDTTPFTYAKTAEECNSAVTALNTLLRNRHNAYVTSIKQGQIPEPCAPAIVIITSYTKLRDILSQEARSELAAFLEKGSPNYNVVVILSEQSNSLNTMALTQWYKQHYTGRARNGIWVGKGIRDQFTLEVTNPTPSMREALSPGFAFSINQGCAIKVKLINSETGDDNP